MTKRTVVAVFSTIVFLLGCGRLTEQSPEWAKDLRWVSIPFAQAEMALPPSYIRTTQDRLMARLAHSDLPPTVAETMRIQLQALEQMEINYILFSDTTNLINNVWCMKSPEYIALDHDLFMEYKGMLESSTIEQWEAQGVESKEIDAQFWINKQSKVMKLKYEINLDSTINYTTQYWVSTQTQTFMLVVNHLQGKDFERSVENLLFEEVNAQ